MGTRVTMNTRSGVDGGEHSAMLDGVMAGAETHGRLWVQIAVTIARRLPPTPRTSHAPVTQHAMT
jgi:hypothetical protein